MKRIVLSIIVSSVAVSGFSQSEIVNAPMERDSVAADSVYKSLELREVTVSSSSRTRMNGDAMITRIVGTPAAGAGTAVDALARVPGMIVRNGNLEVVGKGTPMYYVNGRKLHDTDELQRMSSHDIKDVEVVALPGARYDAQTSAVVRIRTIRRRGDGIGVTIESSEEKALSCGNNRWRSALNVNYRRHSLNVFGGFTFGDNHLGRYATRVTQNTFGKSASYAQNGTTDLSQQYDNLNMHIGTDWQIADNHSVGLKVEHYENLKGVGDFLMTNEVLKDNSLYDRLLSATHTDTSHSRSWLANAYYAGKVGQWGIDCNIDYYATSENVGTLTNELSMNGNREISTSTSTRNRMFATKLVFSHPLCRGKLDLGMELAFVNRNSRYTTDADGIANAVNEVGENTYAVFAEYAKPIRHVGMLSMGVRYEHIDFSYDDPLAPSMHVGRHLDNVYPYVSLAARKGELQGSLSYAVKTRRPSYRTLRSNIEYNNRFTLSSGNPMLRNETRHEVTANARWRFVALSLSYVHTEAGIYDWTYPYGDDGVVLVSWVNFDKPIRQFGAFANLSPSVGVWQPNYTVGLQKQWLSFCLDDPRTVMGKRSVAYNKPMLICNAYNAFRFPSRRKDGTGVWQVELNSELMSACHYGNAEITNWSWNLSCAVQKAFLLGDALVVRLNVGDIFHKAYNNVLIDLGNNILKQSHILGQERGMYDLQRITLTVRYSLNMSRSAYRGKGVGKSFIDRM